MRKAFQFMLLLLGVVSVVSCARWAALASPEERAEHWRSIMPLEVPVGSSRGELMAWLGERELDFHETASPRGMVFEVEEIAGDGWICSVWVIQIHAVFDAGDKIERYVVDDQGVCL